MGPKKSVKFSREMYKANMGMTEWKPNQSKKPKDYYPDAAAEETATAKGAGKDAPAAKSAVPGGKVVANKLEAI
jgi:hypothetical protein